MARLVQGVGYNDADYFIQKVVPVYSSDGGRRSKLVWACPFYKVWNDMLTRCYSSSLHKKKPTYIGCTVSEEWKRFSNFRKWMLAQDWEGKQLDKDLLVAGNKVYSSTTCVFIPSPINSFLTDSRAVRGEHPLGVSWHKHTKKFTTRVSNPLLGTREYLGYYDCPDKAHIAWGKRKHEIALQLAEEQADINIKEALMKRYKEYE